MALALHKALNVLKAVEADDIDKSWHTHDAIARDAEAEWIRLSAAEFERERRGILAEVTAAKKRSVSESSTPDWLSLRSYIDRYLLAVQSQWHDEFEDAAFELAQAQLEAWASELGADAPEADFYAAAWLDTWLEGMAERTTQSSRDQILAMILEAQNDAESLDELANRLVGVFDEWGTDRAKLLAENETAALGNAASMGAFKLWNQPMKEWVTRRDNRVREAHAMIDGQRRLIHEDFDVGGWPAQYPKDWRLPARLSVNCRCQARPVS
jgi:uncharacterized protein with gpF-like domain